MNIKVLLSKFEALEGEDKNNAIILLNALGIDIPKAKSPPLPRGAFTTKLTPYCERITLKCTTCGRQRLTHIHYAAKTVQGQHVLSGHTINADLYESATAPKKDRTVYLRICNGCEEELMWWPKEMLVRAFMHLRKGDAFEELRCHTKKEKEKDA